jgi:DNA helicase-2/ATP-dependent DNA helicase PcrA
MPKNNISLNDQFQELYQSLNAAQKSAVDTIEGPVMVIAGPGTGKTQILACRIGKILLETDAAPQNILCLTYTDAGVVAMRKRLLSFIGPDAYKVSIQTYHSFCNEVIQDNPFYFKKSSLDPISELEQIELLKKMIDQFPKNHPLKRYRGDVYYEVIHLRELFGIMKKEAWQADQVIASIDAYVADLPNRQEYIQKRTSKDRKAGELNVQYDNELNRMERLRAAVACFDPYQKLMEEKNRYDFDDMIVWVNKAFSENPELLEQYQEKFLYILVDEYQDTSGSQNRLVESLISYWDLPNVFVVGDDDQSIYRFQGAIVENMLTLANRYNDDLVKVVLTENYRSSQPILNESMALIDRNADRLVNKVEGISKELKASHPDRSPITHEPTILEYLNQEQEMIGVVNQVEALLAEGVKPGHIGIIYKEHKYGDEISRYFQLKNIPIYTKRSYNSLDLPLVQQLLLILRYLDAEHDVPFSGDEMLFRILHFRFWNIAPMVVSKLSMEVADRRYGANKTSIRALLAEKAASQQPDLFADANLMHAAHIIEELIQDVENLTVQNLIESIIRKTGWIAHILQQDDKHWQLQVLTAFFDHIKEETSRNPKTSLNQLVRLFDLMQDEKISLPVSQTNGTENGVNLMTAHSSKGLEFEHVFVCGMNADRWEKKRGNTKGYKYPDTLFSTMISNTDDQELRRLFYVAMTRAETHLTISFAKLASSGKDREPSKFIAELCEGYPDKIKKAIIPDETVHAFAVLNLSEERRPEIEALEDALISPILDRFVMNVTALNSYLNCPIHFYYNNFIRIPGAKNETFEFGSAVHTALQEWYQQLKNNANSIPTKSFLIEQFTQHMHRHRDSFTQEQFDRRMEYGPQILSDYYDNRLQSPNRIVLLEHNIRSVMVNGVPLKGKLDKLEFNGHDVTIVDYKTGNPENAKKKIVGPDDKNPLGGDYWRQAVFYHLLVANNPGKQWRPVDVVFDFIEPDPSKKYVKKHVPVDPADLETVKQQIQEVWQKIQNREFYVGCGKSACQWCGFVKDNKLAVNWHEALDEGEETD